MNRLLKACRDGTRFCGHCVGSFLLWTVWLGLLILLGAQIYVATAQELAVPRFVLREIGARLSASGLQLEFDRARFDPTGHVFVEGVRIVSTPLGEALLTADHLYAHLDPWDLLVRDVDLTEVRAAGVSLRVPAMLSPSGKGEAVVRDLYATLRFREDDPTFDLVEAGAHIANLELTAAGSFVMPPSRPQSLPVLEEVLRFYLDAARRAAALTTELSAFEAPRLDLVFTPDAAHLAQVSARLQADALRIPADRFRLPGEMQLIAPELRTRQPLRVESERRLDLRVTAREARLGDTFAAQTIDLRLGGRWLADERRFESEPVRVTAGSVAGHGFAARPLVAEAAPVSGGRIHAHLTAGLEGDAWEVSTTLDPRTRAGEVRAGGTLSRLLFERLAARADPRLSELVRYEVPPRIEATVTLDEGGRPRSAEGFLTTGPVIARNVALDAVRGRIAWSGTQVRVDEIELRTPASIARGHYTMDTATRDFRFLLKGSLQPADINGWFRDWWSGFWETFDFPYAPPEADVSVEGRWGRPAETIVFVGASGRNAVLRDVPLDEVHTRLFIRPGYFDGLHFKAVQAGRTARGRFTRVQDLEARALATMDFAVESNLPAEAAANLAGPEVVNLIEPYRFSAPPDVAVEGRITGPAGAGGPRADVTVKGHTDAPMTFYDFPLSRLSFQAMAAGDRVYVGDVVAGFAEGEVRGEGEVTGPADARRLTFDARLENGKVGEAIRVVEEFIAYRAGVPPTPQSRFQQRIASGRLDLSLTAKGLAGNIRSFDGSGNVRISEADLGEINLLGVLSTLLRRTLFNQSTLQLDNAQASFALAGSSLIFPLVRLSGPRAALEASGTYDMDRKQLDFVTKVYPFEESRGLLGSAIGTVLAPLSAVLEVKLTGSMDQPSWAFVYGPTSLFRALTGSETMPPADSPPTEAPPPNSPSPPPPDTHPDGPE